MNTCRSRSLVLCTYIYRACTSIQVCVDSIYIHMIISKISIVVRRIGEWEQSHELIFFKARRHRSMHLVSHYVYCSVDHTILVASIGAFGRAMRGPLLHDMFRSTEPQAVVVVQPRAQRMIWCILIVLLLLMERIGCT